MKSMILAAGRGERLKPLTDTTPKPLLKVGGKCLIEYHIENLVKAGIKDVVINLSWLGDQIEQTIGRGDHYGANIEYVQEGEPPLETGGGIFNALSLLGSDSFVVVNGDIWTDYPYSQLPGNIESLAHLVLVENPVHNPQGDFVLHDQRVCDEENNRKTFSGIGVYRAELFKNCKKGQFPLAPLLRDAMQQKAVTGELYRGQWLDIGTEERLLALDEQFKAI